MSTEAALPAAPPTPLTIVRLSYLGAAVGISVLTSLVYSGIQIAGTSATDQTFFLVLGVVWMIIGTGMMTLPVGLVIGGATIAAASIGRRVSARADVLAATVTPLLGVVIGAVALAFRGEFAPELWSIAAITTGAVVALVGWLVTARWYRARGVAL